MHNHTSRRTNQSTAGATKVHALHKRTVELVRGMLLGVCRSATISIGQLHQDGSAALMLCQQQSSNTQTNTMSSAMPSANEPSTGLHGCERTHAVPV
jgi:homoserine acetyltransferase